MRAESRFFCRLALGALLALLCAGPISRCSASDASGFRIQDFVPGSFTDLEWRIRSTTDLSDVETDDERRYDADGLNILEAYGDELRRSFELSGSSYLRYRAWSVPRFLTFSLNTRLSGSTRAGEDRQTNLGDPPAEASRSEVTDRRFCRVSVEPRMAAGAYLWKDVFLSTESLVEWMYRSDPENRRVRTQESTSGTDQVIVQSYHREVDEQEGDSKTTELSLAVTPGIGRLYEGNFAATAVYIIDALRANGRLLREPSQSELLDLAQVVYYERELHAVDQRLADIAAGNAISAFLVNQGLIGTEDPLAEYLILDVWQYFPTTSRSWGWQLRAGPEWRYTYSSSQTTDLEIDRYVRTEYPASDPSNVTVLTDDHEETHTYDHATEEAWEPSLLLEALHQRPLSPYWHVDVLAAARLGLDHRTETDRRSHVRGHQEATVSTTHHRFDREDARNIALSLTLRYLPNSRTSASFRGEYAYERETLRNHRVSWVDGEQASESLDKTTHSASRILLSAEYDYRISVPLTFAVASELWLDRASWDRDDLRQTHSGYAYSFMAAVEYHIY